MAATISQLKAEVVVEGADEAKRDIAAVGDEIDRQAKRSTSAADMTKRHDAALTKLGTGAMVAGGALLAGFGLAVGAAANFDKAMSGVGAVSNASAKDMDRLREAALKAGADTAFSASEAADAEAELAKAGVSTADILGGALKGSLDLAAAGQISVADAATISAQALNIFQLEGSDTAHVADLLAAGANKSAADVSQLGQALQQGGLLAKQTGLSLEDTVGALSLFADNALIGSDAGTSLKTMLQRLTPQSVEAESKMRELGISAYDAQGQFVGLDKFAGNLRDSLKSLTPEQRNSALATIFGSDAVRGANILYEAGAKGVKEYTKAVNDQGAAGRMAGKQLDNLSGDLEQLRGSLETALINGGSQANGALRGMTQAATGAVNAFSDLPGPLQATVTGIAGIGGAGLLIAGGFGVMIPKVRDGVGAVKDFVSWAKTAGTVGKVAAGGVGAFALAGAGLAVYGLVSSYLDDATESAKKWVDTITEGSDLRNIDGQVEAYQKLSTQIDRTAEKARKALDGNDTMFNRRGQRVADWIGLSDGEFTKQDKRLDALISKQEKLAGTLHNLNSVRVNLADVLGKDGITTAELSQEAILKVADSVGVDLVGKSRVGKDAVDKVAQALAGQTSAAYGTKGSFDALDGSVSNAADELEGFKTKMDALLGVHLSAREAEIGFEESIDSLTQSIVDNGATFDITNEKGRANETQLIASTKAALAHADAVGKETGSLGLANITLAGHINQMADAAKATGLNDAQVLLLLEDLYKIPPDVASNIHTTADLVAYLVRDLHRDIDNLPSNKDVNINVWRREHAVYDDSGGFVSGGGGPGHASGGKIAMGGEWLVIGKTIAEQGNELVHLPGGSQVFNTATTDRMKRGGDGGSIATPPTVINLTVRAPLGTSPMRWARDLANGLEELSQFGGGNLGARFANSDA